MFQLHFVLLSLTHEWLIIYYFSNNVILVFWLHNLSTSSNSLASVNVVAQTCQGSIFFNVPKMNVPDNLSVHAFVSATTITRKGHICAYLGGLQYLLSLLFHICVWADKQTKSNSSFQVFSTRQTTHEKDNNPESFFPRDFSWWKVSKVICAYVHVGDTLWTTS